MTSEEVELDELLEPSGVAVIVIDKQRGFLDPKVSPILQRHDVSRIIETVDRIDSFVEACRGYSINVVWTRMIQSLSLSPRNIATRLGNDERPFLIEPGTVAFEYTGATSPRAGEFTIEKPFFDAFASTTLSDHLRQKGVRTIVCVGAYAGRCVLATAFGANGHGFDVVLARGLAVPHVDFPEELRVAEATIASILGYVIEPSELLARWGHLTAR